MGGEKMQRKFKILAVILVCALAASTVAALGPTIASWTQSSISSITSYAATDSFTTTVVGAATNAVNTPVTINGYSFTTSTITGFTPAVQSGDGANPSTVTMTSGNFVPGTYVEFWVTIKNTGTATLAFQPCTYDIWFVDSSGTMIPFTDYYLYPAIAIANPGTTGPKVDINVPWTLSDFGTDNLAAYLVYLDTSWNTNWVADFSYLTSGTLPATLAPGATFTYHLFIGLGSDAPYGIPGMYFSLSIPLMPAT
jgi:hypothetical protein